MASNANAVLTRRYTIAVTDTSYNRNTVSDVAMVTIEIKSKSNKPLMILQSKDNHHAIENTLRQNGWIVVSWDGDNLQLNAPISANYRGPMTPAQQVITQENNKVAAVGCLSLVIVITLIVVVVLSLF